MPVQGPQQPGFYLPGAEYFNLSPNAHIALQGRRRLSFATPVTTVPSDSTVNLSISQVIETGFTDNSGVYIHWFELDYSPILPLGNMAVSGLSAILQSNPNQGISLGYAVLTNPSPTTSVVVLIERERLITSRDMNFGLGSVGTLTLTTNVSVHNSDPTVSLQALASAKIVYTRLDGIIE